MNQSIPQPGPRARLLPFPGPDLYLETTPSSASLICSRIAANSLGGKLSPWQRLSRSGVAPARKVWHVLYLHRRAFEADRAGHHNQADFYWQALARYLRRVWNDSAAWEAAAAQLAVSGLDGPALRRHCMDELFLDTHIALAHGLICAGAPYMSASLALHIAAVERLLRLKEANQDEMVGVLYPLVAAEVAGLRAAGMDAAALARMRGIQLDVLKQKFTATLADLVFRDLIARMKRLPEHAGSGRLDLITATIHEIEALRVAHPGILVLYQLLGLLHQLQCVQMANEDMLADALVACEQARTYWPDLVQIEETREALRTKMSELQKAMAELARQMRVDDTKSLSVEGLRLKADAERGLGPAQNFIKSPIRAAIAAARDNALTQADSDADGDDLPPEIDKRLHIAPVPQQPGKGWSSALWLFAAQDRRSQAMLAGALAFNVAVGAVVAYELSQRGERDAAVAALRVPGASDEQVMAASVRFLDAQTPGLRDPRSTEVEKVYAYAFTRWFGNVADPSDAGASSRIAEYRDLGSRGELP